MALSFLYIDENIALHDNFVAQSSQFNEVKSTHCFTNIKSARKFMENNAVDVIFIDPNFSKVAGFDFIEQNIQNFFFVLHSPRTKDAVKGYELGVFDFFPKPFDPNRFLVILKRLNKQEYVLEKQRAHLPQPYIEVRCDLMKERIAHDDISHIEAMGDYIKIVTEKRKYVVLMSMKKMEELLPKEGFFRTHKSHIVNTGKIQNYNGKEIVLNKVKIPVSRFKKKIFLDHMQNFKQDQYQY